MQPSTAGSASDSYQAILLRSLEAAASLDSAKTSIPLMARSNSAAQPVDQQRPPGWQSRARSAHMADRVAERASLEAEKAMQQAEEAVLKAAEANRLAKEARGNANAKLQHSVALEAGSKPRQLRSPEHPPSHKRVKLALWTGGKEKLESKPASRSAPAPRSPSPERDSSYTYFSAENSEDEPALEFDKPNSAGGDASPADRERDMQAGFLPDLISDYDVSLDTLPEHRIDDITNRITFDPKHSPRWVQLGKAAIGLLRYGETWYEGRSIRLRETDKTDDGYVRMQLLAAFLDTTVASLAAMCLGDKNSEAEQRFHARISGGWLQMAATNLVNRRTRAHQAAKHDKDQNQNSRLPIGAGEFDSGSKSQSGKGKGKAGNRKGTRPKGGKGFGGRRRSKGEGKHSKGDKKEDDPDDGSWGFWLDPEGRSPQRGHHRLGL